MENEKNKITQARTNLILDHAFFGTLALKLKPVISKLHPHAWTDGKVLGFNPDHLKSLSVQTTETTICHEVLHVGLGHPWREAGRNHGCWNRACDYAINPIPKEAGFIFPEHFPMLIDARFTGMSAEQIYAILDEEDRQEASQKQKDIDSQDEEETSSDSQGDSQETAGEKGSEDGPGDDNSGGMDDSMGEGKKGQETALGGQEGANPGGSETVSEGEEQDCGMGEVLPCQDEDSEAMEADWEVAMFQAAQAAMAQGTLPGLLKGVIEEMQKPVIDWKAALWKFMQRCTSEDYSWTKPNRRYLPMSIYLPAMQSEKLPPIVIGWDTSGSTQYKQQEFGNEVADVIQSVRPELTHIIYADAKVQAVDEFTADEQVTFRPGGFGGTSFVPVFEWIEKEGIDPACLIYFTDLEGTFPDDEPPYPVLWIDCAGTEVAPWGETIKIP